jgi:hypothetical protein
MARWNSVNTSWTPTAVGDAANFTSNGIHALQGASSTQRMNILEVYEGGQGTASSTNFMVLARDSTFAAGTVTSGTNGKAPAALDPATAALTNPPITYCAVTTTQGQRSSTLYLLNLSFNAFGGIVRWVAAPGEEIGMLGNTASFGETSISAFTGSGVQPLGTHFVFEPF